MMVSQPYYVARKQVSQNDIQAMYDIDPPRMKRLIVVCQIFKFTNDLTSEDQQWNRNVLKLPGVDVNYNR